MTTQTPAATTGGPFKPGDVLAGKYRIVRLMGQGGMAAVYLAHHELLHAPVAIKMLLPHLAVDATLVTRFMNEARHAAQIRSEHAVSILDVVELDGGGAFMVLECLEGRDLASLAQERGPLPVEETVDYVLQALEAVAQAHALGIIHRDLKPSNLFLALQPDGRHVIKVLDFGISKRTDAAESVTATGGLLGSPGFMAPEQIRHSKSVDARADIWSVGATLFRLLTNRKPFAGEDTMEVLAAVLETSPPLLRTLRPDAPPALEAVVARCLRRERDERYRTVEELARALEPVAPVSSGQHVDRICRILSGNRLAPAPELQASSGPAAAQSIDIPIAVEPASHAQAAQSVDISITEDRPGRAQAATRPGPPAKLPALDDDDMSAQMAALSRSRRTRTALGVAATLLVLGAGGVGVFSLLQAPGGGATSETRPAQPSHGAVADQPPLPRPTASAGHDAGSAAPDASVAPAARPLAAGRDLMRSKRWAEAIVFFERALAYNPKLAEAHKLLGVCYFQSDDPAQGAKHYEQYLRMNPGDREATRIRGSLCAYYEGLGTAPPAGSVAQPCPAASPTPEGPREWETAPSSPEPAEGLHDWGTTSPPSEPAPP